MSFIFTADWHIKTRFREVPVSWIADRYVEWLIFLEDQRINLDTDTLVIGGDLFDKVPTLFDLALFATIGYTTNFKEIVIFPGNHELLSKYKSFYDKLEILFPQFNWLTKGTKWRNWHIIPYPELKRDPFRAVVGCDRVISHARCASDRGLYEAELDFEAFAPCRMVLLGDIHEHRKLTNNIWYPGAPYDTAFTRLPLKPRHYFFIDDDDTVYIHEIPKNHKRLIKVETTMEHYQSVRDKVANSKHYYDIEILVDSVSELDNVQGEKMVKVKLKDANTQHEEADTIEEEMFNYLVQTLGMANDYASKVMNMYKELSDAI